MRLKRVITRSHKLHEDVCNFSTTFVGQAGCKISQERPHSAIEDTAIVLVDSDSNTGLC